MYFLCVKKLLSKLSLGKQQIEILEHSDVNVYSFGEDIHLFRFLLLLVENTVGFEKMKSHLKRV